MLVLCSVVHQPHSVSVCLFLVRGGRCRSRTAESDSAHAVPKGRLLSVFSRDSVCNLKSVWECRQLVHDRDSLLPVCPQHRTGTHTLSPDVHNRQSK